MAKAKGWRNNRSDIPDEPGSGNPDHPDHEPASEAADEPKKKKKPKQRELPTMEREQNKKIEKLADTYVERRNERMAMLESEIAARDLLFAAMIEEKLPRYEYGSRVIEILKEEKVKVRSKKDAAEGEEASDE